jgi:putative ABC transport system permease protein
MNRSGPRRLFRLPSRGDEVRQEVEDELRFHLEERAARLEAEGMSPTEARAEAERRFGDVDRIADDVEEVMKRRERAMRQSDRIDDARRDIGFAGRQILKDPGFATVAALTIAMAIGSTTAIFSVVDGIMLRPLPYEEPEELVMIWADWTRRDVVLPDKRREWLSWPAFADFRDEVGAVEHMSAFQGWQPTLTGIDGGAEQLSGASFSLGMFSEVFRVAPALGRGFLAEEDRPDGPRAVLISDGFWRRAFGADASILDQTIRLNDVPFQVVGVMPPDFSPPAFLGTDVWTTLQFDRTNGGSRGSIFLRSVGRLTDGDALDLARSQATQLALRLEAEYPQEARDTGFNVYPLQFDMVNQASAGLWMLLGAVGLVLLIACVNVANLLLARGAGRSGELAVRVALGAGRRRVLSQLMTESLILAAAGGALGIGLAFLGTDVLVRMAPSGTPLLEQVAVDARILGFAALVTMLTGSLFGILPAVRAARTDPAGVLREGGRSGASTASARLRNGLVVGQVALALILLVGAGLLLRSFQNLRTVDLGFDATDVVSMQIQLPQTRYPDGTSRQAFFAELEQSLGTVPGVAAVGSITNLPLAGFDGDTRFNVEGQPLPEPGTEPSVWLRRVTPGYFDALDLELVAGRAFDTSDDFEAPRVVIVNETLARDYFGGNAVGQRLNVNDPAEPVWREIVGVARDIKNFGIRAESRNALYLPYAQSRTSFMFTAVETSIDPEVTMSAIRTEVAELDPDIALAQLQPMEDLVATSLAVDRFTTSLLSGFAIVALLLAVVGLYGVVSYSVSMRMREMGVRIALGAPGGEIRTLVLRWALGLAAGGIVLGALGAAAATRLIEGLLFGVTGTDVVTFATVAGVMAAAAVVASLIPAVHATRVDPIEVLNAE